MLFRSLLGLGANVGNREANLRWALGRLAECGQVGPVSALYETEPEGVPGQPPYLNAATRFLTDLGPPAVLEFIALVERLLGRRPGPVQAPRPIDIDILLFDDLVLDTPALTIPHPRLHLRRFVLQPLVDIAAERPHPLLGQTMRELLDALPDAAWVRPYRRQWYPMGRDVTLGGSQAPEPDTPPERSHETERDHPPTH